jgi:hypothetical protein
MTKKTVILLAVALLILGTGIGIAVKMQLDRGTAEQAIAAVREYVTAKDSQSAWVYTSSWSADNLGSGWIVFARGDGAPELTYWIWAKKTNSVQTMTGPD